MKNTKFLGQEVSSYGVKNGKVDYSTLAKTFNHVLCNLIAQNDFDYLSLENGNDYNEDGDYFEDIFQYFIIDTAGVNILKEYTNEIVYYDEKNDIYLWGVTHYGTSWDYVLTDIPLN